METLVRDSFVKHKRWFMFDTIKVFWPNENGLNICHLLLDYSGTKSDTRQQSKRCHANVRSEGAVEGAEHVQEICRAPAKMDEGTPADLLV
ncbi:MAG: hypothetical protein EOQ56_15005 [Mesorhizobium sp.]|nr:MAG: hypothetical protein EOQ56_15005 [Mesorhizobium sp.]